MKNNFKSYKSKISLFLSILIVFQLVIFNGNTINAATTTSISYTVSGNTTVGNTIEIAVNVSNVSDLYGGSIDFLYDTSLLEVQSISKGTVFGSNEILTPLGTSGKINNGQASFAITLKGNKAGITASNGTVAVIKAKVLKAGTVKLNTIGDNSSLSLSGNTVRVKLANSNGGSISYSSTNINMNLVNYSTTRIEQNNSKIKYSGSWLNYSNSACSNGNEAYSYTASSFVAITFTGTGIRWISDSNASSGIAKVSIDGGAPITIDNYSNSSTFQKVAFEKLGLSQGTHTLKIEVTGTKNPSAKAANVVVDAFEIIDGNIL